MQNSEVAALFDELADLLEIQGANPFRTRAYRNASRTLTSMTDAVEDIANKEPAQLLKIKGIGKDLAEKIVDITKTGKLKQLEELKASIPEVVIQITRIDGVGPKKAKLIHDELKVESLDDLKNAAQEGKLAKIKGFGKKTQDAILRGLSDLGTIETRVFLADALPMLEEIAASLRTLKSVKQVELAGSSRRGRDTVHDLDVLVAADDSKEAMDHLAAHDLVSQVNMRGDTKMNVKLQPLNDPITFNANGLRLELDMRVVPPKSMGAAMQYFTGSKEHNVVLRQKAKDRGWSLNEYGLTEGNKVVASETEEEIYKALDLNWIPPELRENRGEIERAERENFPDLLTIDDIRGDLHMHTTASDGKATIEEMIAAAKERGLEYIAITDHSKRVSMANGLDDKRLLKHWEAIREIREKTSGIEVLCGVECDILENAKLDISDEVLAEADWVIAVIHFGLRQPREQINKRLIAAIENPHVHAIGHMTGRLINKRPPADVSIDDVFKAAADHGVLMEINAHPARLDLSEIHAARAKDFGIPIIINTDSHTTQMFDLLQWGIKQARRAGLTKEDVANTRTLKEFQKMLRTA